MKKVHVKGLDTVINGVSIRKMKKWLRHQLVSQIRTSIRSRVGRTEAVRQEVESVYEVVYEVYVRHYYNVERLLKQYDGELLREEEPVVE